MFKISISPEEIGELTLAAFPGEITVIDAVDDKFFAAVRYLRRQTVLGFDTETRPSFSPEQHSNVLTGISIERNKSTVFFHS